jgi:hypothetical protein
MPDTTDPASTLPQPPAGLECRQVDRTPPPPPRVIGRARILAGQAWHSPGMDPKTWYPVLKSNPEVTTPPLPGWMWIELHGKPRNVWAAHFEMKPEAPTPHEEHRDDRPE